MFRNHFIFAALLLALVSRGALGQTQNETLTNAATDAVRDGYKSRTIAFAFADINAPIAGVAADETLAFVGEPLDGSVIVLSRFTGKQVGELPPPPNGFSLPFIMHAIGQDRVAVLDAGGLPGSFNLFDLVSSVHLRVHVQFQPRQGILGNSGSNDQFRRRALWLPRRFCAPG